MELTKENIEQEQKLKAMEAERLMQAQCGCDVQTQTPDPPTFMERVRQNLEHSRKEMRRADNLSELQYLLEKNPDMARILELLELNQVLGGR